ncbi:hypothetical protein [Pontibacter sp. H249]|uniref:hypothetical protein n=1 Tax=Pontibacter sp. H249 TaxID=3133420 RepID=UPI0030C57FC7
MNFEPPIAERETGELIQIANFPDDWNPLAIEQAKKELLVRNVPVEYENKKVEALKRFKKKKNTISSKRRADEAFEWHEFIFNFSDVLVVMLFDWDMKKDGYLRKHRQRKYVLSIVILLILLIYILSKL